MYGALANSANEKGTILCFGIDPDINRIKLEGTVGEKIRDYYFPIIDALLRENQISAIKPNFAYFAQYGFEGFNALKSLIGVYKGRIPVILDAKRCDIDRSAYAYAREAYEFWDADGITVSPYMGSDSITPFLQNGKIVYMLCRTSNPGGADFQELKFKGKFLYEHVAVKAVEWKAGLVVGATSDAIKRVMRITKGKNVPLLIPGIGAQGGDLKMVLRHLKQDNPAIHRISASSSIAFAYEKSGGPPVEAALKEAKLLNKSIGGLFK